MLVTFDSKAGQLSIRDHVAIRFLKLMGHSGTVPGAILAGDLPAALKKLETAAAALQGGATEAETPAGERVHLDPSFAKEIEPLLSLVAETARHAVDLTWK